jgi:hypothetical protein
LALCFDPGFSPILSPLNPTVFDLLDDGSKYYGKPLVTVGTIPFGVNSDAILQQFVVSIGSWLRSSAQIVVHLYDVVDGMGALVSPLLESLQQELGRDRVTIGDKINKKLKIETVTESIEIIERHTETVFAVWFNTDMILAPDWMEHVYASMQCFGEYTNYSMHFVRRDPCVWCWKDISLGNIARTEWPLFFAAFRQRCLSRLHRLGYHCYLWNHRGVNMTAANAAPFFIGRPDFDGAIISKQMSFV